MNHVAIDLGSKHSQVCVREADGTIVLEKKHPTPALAALMSSWGPSRVILETSSEAFRIADAAKSAGHEVRVVPSTLARQLGVGMRRMKTDQRDARTLSEASCRILLPTVHVPEQETRELRSLLRSREVLVEGRTKLINHVKGWLRAQLWRLARGTPATVPARVRECAATKEATVPPHIEQMLRLIEHYTTELTQANRVVCEKAKSSEICRRLMTIPGVGPVTAVTFVATVEDHSRFPQAYRLQSYLGLTPGESSSGEKQQRTGITKAGSTAMRRLLIQAAWSAIRHRPSDPMVRWAAQIANRRGRFIAVVALARKLAGIMFALWRDNSTYVSNKGAQRIEAPAL